jgi:hypothetical protein
VPVSDPRSAPSSASSGVTPCVGCGLCCDGTVFEKAKVRPGDEAGLKKHGMSVVTENGTPFFLLPCRHHECGRCTIYAERFSTCHNFKCALLTSFEAGEITLEDAQQKVAKALRLRSEIAADDPGAAVWTQRQRSKAELASSRANPRLLLTMIALDRYLDTWFRKRRKTDADTQDRIESSAE